MLLQITQSPAEKDDAPENSREAKTAVRAGREETLRRKINVIFVDARQHGNVGSSWA